MKINNKLKHRIGLCRDYLLGKEEVSFPPIELIVEATNRCNLNCIMCPREKIKSAPEDIKLPLFRKIVGEASNFLELIDFSFRGEPLMNQNIFEMISYAKSKGIKTYMSTNANLLDKDASMRLLYSGLDLLEISLDAFSEETYTKIRRNGDFNKVINNLEVLLHEKQKIKNNLFVEIGFVPLLENYSQMDNFMSHWKNNPSINAARIKPFSTRAGLISNPLYNDNIPYKTGFSRNRCVRLWRSLSICSDGTVLPCCYDFSGNYKLGDLKHQTIKEIWNGKALIGLRKQHAGLTSVPLELCSRCELLRISTTKQSLTFLCSGLNLRKMLARFDKFYRLNKKIKRKEI